MFEHALRHIRGVLAQQPEHREASELKAVILTDLKRDEDAVALYLELVARHRESDPEYALTLVAKALKIAPRNNELQELRIALSEPGAPGESKNVSASEPEDSKARALRLGSVLRKVASRKQPGPTEDSGARKLPRLNLGKRPTDEGSGASSLPPLASTKGGRVTSTDDSGQIRFRAPKPSRPHTVKPMVSEVVELDVEEFEEVEVEEVRTPAPARVPRPPPPRSLRGLPRRPGSKSAAKTTSKTNKGRARLNLNLGSRKSQGQSKEPSSSPAKSESKSSDDKDGDAGDPPGHAGKSVAASNSPLPSKEAAAGEGSKASKDAPSKAAAEASPSKDVAEASPSKDVAEASPSKDVAEASPSKDVAEASPSKDVAEASPSKDVAEVTPSKDAAEASSESEAESTLSNAAEATLNKDVTEATSNKDVTEGAESRPNEDVGESASSKVSDEATSAQAPGEHGSKSPTPAEASEETAEVPASEVTQEPASEDSDAAWPDIADEVDELAFFISQGFEDDARFTFMDLDQRHPGHPALEPFRTKFSSGVVLEPSDSSASSEVLGASSTTVAIEDAGAAPADADELQRADESKQPDEEVVTSEERVEHVGIDGPQEQDVSEATSQAVASDKSAEPSGEDTATVVHEPADGAQQAAVSDAGGASTDEPVDESVSQAESAQTPEQELAATSSATNQRVTEDSVAAYIDPDEEEQLGQDPIAEAPEEPQVAPEGVSPEDALDGLALADELEREAEQPEPEPEPEPEPDFEDFTLGDEDLEGDDFLTSIFAPPEENNTAPAKDVKVPARARATIDESADARTLFDLGTAYREMGLVDDAIAQFEMAAQDPAWTARALVMMASLHLHRGETDKATADLDEAIGCASTDAERSEARYELAVVCQMVGNNDKARELLEAVGAGYRDRDERLAELKA